MQAQFRVLESSNGNNNIMFSLYDNNEARGGKERRATRKRGPETRDERTRVTSDKRDAQVRERQVMIEV